MSYLLRKISIAKWEPNLTLQPENFTADAITGCTRTSGNTLSVWSSDSMNFSTEEVEKIVVALATTMSAPDTVDLIWLDEQWLNDNGVAIDYDSEGDSKFSEVNHLHRDLIAIDHRQLAVVGQHIVEQYNANATLHYKRYSRPQLIALVNKWLDREGTFELEDLHEKWIKQLEKIRVTP
ncbi:hypothetical protein [Pantoea sp. GM01]|uniref:hypothetical protein n=1 Tax=Pantoea sp. GM01 TaxID=1144320 RepID=UPI000270DA24|nr:hypothetical protein [Pantoea sp. GM01]EJL87998.1 hypothetical protein PMI17_02756 [Pantoea sp. GM01]